MKLHVDLGNSRLKWRLGSGPVGIVELPPEPHEGLRWLDEVWAGLEPPKSVYLAAVAREATQLELRGWIQGRWPKARQVWLKSRRSVCGVRVCYETPERFGIDRLAALVAARQIHRNQPLLVIDAGTALTADLLDESGHHQGGLIMPGLGMMHTALLAGTAIDRGAPCEATASNGVGLACSTEAALEMGPMFMLAACVDRLIDEVSAGDGRTQVVLTGGDAEALRRALGARDSIEYVPDLVLDGVAELARALR